MQNHIQQRKINKILLTAVDGKGVRFEDFFLQFLKWKGKEVSLSTFRNYKVIYNRFVPLLGNKLLNNITGVLLDDIFDSINVTTSSRKTYRQILSAVFNDAIRLELLTHNPCKKMRKIRKAPSKNRVTLPTEGQVREYIRKAKNEDNNFIYKLFLLAVATGMRLGELLNLKRCDINLEDASIDIRGQLTAAGPGQPLKTDSSYRKIYVAREILHEVLCNTPDFYIFTPNNISYRQIARRTADKYIHQFIKGLNAPDGFTFHLLRHYHATQLLYRGINLKEVSKRLGHASINITADIYTHWLEEMDKGAAEVLGKDLLE